MLKVVYKSTPMQTCTQNLFPIPVVEVTVERKTFAFFAVSEASVRVFSPKYLWPHLHNNWPGAICERLLREILVFYQNAKVFSLESFPLYGIIFYIK